MSRVLAVAAVFTTLVTAACGQNARAGDDASIDPKWTRMPEVTSVSEFPVDPTLTEALAQQKAVDLLSEALGASPHELSLVLGDQWNGDPLDPRLVGACIFGSDNPDDPQRLLIDYLVVGQTRPPTDYLVDFARGWSELGWEVRTNPANRAIIQAISPDHFMLTASVATNGDTAFTIASQCFPGTNRNGAPPLPETIPHP
ncbi:hypothetical protein [Nocardia sp. CC227C]|uniref:hypothetical protein n=1 Tax=Nocardia sp. CC227C TaxID=3044562 RepID=UPI00278C1F8C|nr:hypothetical protein [Nocardia sp. CC227C]